METRGLLVRLRREDNDDDDEDGHEAGWRRAYKLHSIMLWLQADVFMLENVFIFGCFKCILQPVLCASAQSYHISELSFLNNFLLFPCVPNEKFPLKHC